MIKLFTAPLMNLARGNLWSGSSSVAANSAEAQQFFDRLFTPPTPGGAEEIRWNTFIDGLVADGVWAKLDALYLWFAGMNEGDALVNLIQSDYISARAQWAGSLTFTLNSGFSGGNTGRCIRSNFNPSTAVSANFLRDNHCAFLWLGNNTTINAAALNDGVVATPAATQNYKIEVWPRYAGNVGYWNACGTEKTVASVTDSSGLHVIERTAASGTGAAKWFRNDVEQSADTSASSALPNTELYYECGFLSRAAGFGASLSTAERTALYDRLVTLTTDIVGGVP